MAGQITIVNGTSGTTGYLATAGTSFSVTYTAVSGLRYRLRTGANGTGVVYTGGAAQAAASTTVTRGTVSSPLPAGAGTSQAIYLQEEAVLNSGVWADTGTVGAIVREDLTPETYTALAQSATGVGHGNTYWASWSSTTPPVLGGLGGGTITAFTVSGVTPVTITATNGEFAVNNIFSTTYYTTLSNVAAGSTIYFRAVASTLASTLTTHSLQIGDTTRSFTLTTGAVVPDRLVNLATSPVVYNSAMPYSQSSITCTVTNGTSGHEYAVFVGTVFANTQAGIATANGSGVATITVPNASLPTAGTTWVNSLNVRVPTAIGGNNIWSPYANGSANGGAAADFFWNWSRPAAQDITPNGFTALAGAVTGASLSTYYYATFSATAAGTTNPGTGYVLSDVNDYVTVAVTNGQFRTAGNATWRSTSESVINGETVYFRGLSSSAYSTGITHTLQIGGTSRSFTTTTGFFTTLGVGTVSRTPAGDISGGATSVVVNFTGTINHKYKLVQTAPSVADMVVGSVLGATGATSLTLTSAASALPGENNVWTYKVQVIREIANGGDGIWYDATGTAVSFTIFRIYNPTVANDQGFDTTYNNTFFTHQMKLKVEGNGGIHEFAYADTGSSTGTYPTTWSTDRSCVVARGTSYYFWSRRRAPGGPSTDASDFDRIDTPVEVPAWQGIDVTDSTYGIQINNASGVPVLTMASRIIRLLDSGTTAAVAAGASYTSPPISSIDTYINSHVAIISPSDAVYKLNSFSVSVDYTAKTFTVINNTGSSKTFSFYVFRSG
jgi:hypothetical protein